MFPKKKSKIKHLETELQEKNIIIGYITETHLNEDIDDSEIYIQNYQVFRTDRQGRQKGGVAQYVRKDLVVQEDSSFDNKYIEINIIYISNINIISAVVYRPPGCEASKFKEGLDFLKTWIEKKNKETLIKKKPPPLLLINGDFNLPKLRTWNEEDVIQAMERGDTSQEANNEMELINFTTEHGLSQRVKKTTRYENTLDLIFSSEEELIDNIEKVTNIIISDHDTILAKFNRRITNRKKQDKENYALTCIPLYNIHKLTTNQKEDLDKEVASSDWEGFSQMSVQQKYDKMLEILETAVIKVATPKNKNHTAKGSEFKSNNKIAREIRKAYKKKNKASKQLEEASKPQRIHYLREKIKKQEEIIVNFNKDKIRKSEIEAFEQIKEDPKKFYSYVKKL